MLQFAQIDVHSVLELRCFRIHSEYVGLDGMRERVMSSPGRGGRGRRGGASNGRPPSPWQP